MLQNTGTKDYKTYFRKDESHMSFNDVFSEMERSLPSEYDMNVPSTTPMTPSYQPMYSQLDVMDQSLYASWDDYVLGLRGVPVLYNAEAYTSPYVQNWINPAGLMGELQSEMQLNLENQKLDPNKIFSPDITNLKALAADQQKIVKLFESKLKESLTERGKVGLTEEDIEAMQALTAARSAITAMNKSQVDIKKNIADIRLKQQQNATRADVSSSTQTGGGKPLSAFDTGRSIMDNIFSAIPTPPSSSSMSSALQETSLDDASRFLDDALPVGEVSEHIRYENMNPTTYVLIGDSDTDVEYATYADDGTLIPDYPNPTNPIEKIDRDAGTAVDNKFISYPLKKK